MRELISENTTIVVAIGAYIKDGKRVCLEHQYKDTEVYSFPSFDDFKLHAIDAIKQKIPEGYTIIVPPKLTDCFLIPSDDMLTGRVLWQRNHLTLKEVRDGFPLKL